MVCDKCLEKQKAKGQSGNIVPDRWKEGATNHGKVAAGDKRISSKELHNPYTKTKERYMHTEKAISFPFRDER